MIATTIAIFSSIRDENGKRQRVTVYPETVDLFDPERLIVAYYIRPDDQYVTIPGTEFSDVQAEWLAQFAL